MLILFYFIYILLNLENVVFFLLRFLNVALKLLNIGGAVIKTQCFLFLGLLWYQEMLPFYHRRQIFLFFSTLQYMDSYVFLKTGFFNCESLIYAKLQRK